MTLWFCDSMTPGLCDSMTPWLRDFMFPCLWLHDPMTLSLCVSMTRCDSMTRWLHDPIGLWFMTLSLCISMNLWLHDPMTLWLCDFMTLSLCSSMTCHSVSPWIGDSITPWHCDSVTLIYTQHKRYTNMSFRLERFVSGVKFVMSYEILSHIFVSHLPSSLLFLFISHHVLSLEASIHSSSSLGGWVSLQMNQIQIRTGEMNQICRVNLQTHWYCQIRPGNKTEPEA